MGLFTKDVETLEDLFVHQAQDMFYAEQQIVKALPQMIEKAKDPQLRQGFQRHLGESETHVRRIEQIFNLLGKMPKAIDCPAIDGIMKEANQVVGDAANDEVRDAALIASAQAVEHYEIARYGTLIAWAKRLGRNDCATLLQKTLEEEKAADAKLTSLAESNINRNAA